MDPLPVEDVKFYAETFWPLDNPLQFVRRMFALDAAHRQFCKERSDNARR